MSRLLSWLEERPRWIVFLLNLTGVLVVDLADSLVPAEIVVTVLYLVPIGLATWAGGRTVGSWIAAAAIFDEWGSEMLVPQYFESPAVPFVNAMLRLGIFLAFVWVLSELRVSLQRERGLARVDPLTGAANVRSFREAAALEIARAARHKRPLTIAYLDVDLFKQVNDSLGHAGGDEVLREVARVARGAVRTVDLFARLGGDEFAVLLPETGADQARVAVERLRREMSAAVRKRGWPCTFSIGAVTYLSPPESIDRMIQAADDLMYAVKRSGRDDVRYHIET